MPRPPRNPITLAIVLACLGVIPRSVEAGFIADRAILNSILGGSAINENFETFSISNGSTIPLGLPR
jgi:hypothetical protein